MSEVAAKHGACVLDETSNPDEAYKLMADFAKVSEAAVRYSFEHKLIGVASSYVPDVEGIVATEKVAQELGFAPDGVDLPSFAKKFNNVTLATEVAKAK